MEDQTIESLEVPRILLVYYNDAFLRTRKGLGNYADLSKRSPSAQKKDRSPTSMEIIAKGKLMRRKKR